MSNQQPQTLKGFRDFLPNEMRIRNYVIDVFKDVFASYGFEPLQTPSLEYAQVLLDKYGEDADRLVYQFKDFGGRRIAMPYDLTVPAARVLAKYQNEIELPFKRYQIQRIWRAEKPQKGRYREVLQCDIDIYGSPSVLADAEIITVIYETLKKLEFDKFTIKINSRKALYNMLEEKAKITEEKWDSVLQTLDKLDKKGKLEAKQELIKKGLPEKKVKDITNYWKTLNPVEADPDLKKLALYLDNFGIDEQYIQFTPTLVRGLDYYTGAIFETVIEDADIGSVTGGGRYDNLIKKLGGPDIPAVGTTLGLDRICDAAMEIDLFQEKVGGTAQVLVTVFGGEFADKSIQVLKILQQKSIPVILYPDTNQDLGKQLKYANRKKIPFVAIIGPEEAKKNKATLKNMKSGEQKMVQTDKLHLELQNTDQY